MTININDFSLNLLETIRSNDLDESLSCIQKFKEGIRTDASYVVWISDPSNLNSLQKSITESFGIPQKAMMVKARPGTSRGQRAAFFIQAMENSLKRLSDHRATEAALKAIVQVDYTKNNEPVVDGEDMSVKEMEDMITDLKRRIHNKTLGK